jgi:hypothetical protein
MSAPQYAKYSGVGGGGSGGGVTSVNGATGALTLAAGSGISVGTVGTTITISATGGGGTVTSVGMTVPSILSVTPSTITTSGTFALTLATQAANSFFAGPTTGAAATPTFRAIVAGDLPAGTGTVTSVGLTLPSFLSVTPSTITSAGTFTVTLATQTANLVFASPNGSTGAPTFRSLVAADLPANVSSLNTLTGAVTLAAGTGITLTPSGNTITVAASSSGGITGPGTSINTAIATWNGTTGAALLNNDLLYASDVLHVTDPATDLVIPAFTVRGGNQVAVGASHDGGALTLLGGGITNGTSFGTAGAVNITGGANAGLGNGGAITLTGGTSASAFAGSVNLLGGFFNTSSTNNGNVNLFANGSLLLQLVGSNGSVTLPSIGSSTVLTTGAGSTITGLSSLTIALGGTGQTSFASGALSSNGTALTSGTLSVANGGTGAGTFTSHGVLLGNTTAAITATALGAAGAVLTGVSSAAPTFQAVPGNTSILKAPALTVLSSTGATAGRLFSISIGNATVGATYTNNSQTFTVLFTVVSANAVFMSGVGAPTSSGTLTKASGTGDASITFSAAAPYATYTTPSSPAPLYLRIRAVGGGGGGAASGTTPGTASGGSATVFGNLQVNCIGGGAGSAAGGTVAFGGAASGSATGLHFTGSDGGGFAGDISGAPSGSGGCSAFGGSGAGGNSTGTAQPGQSGQTGTGSGGGGAGGTTSTPGVGGGASGGFEDVVIATPATTYPYIVGVGGTGATLGTGGAAGGNGGNGTLIIEAMFQ